MITMFLLLAFSCLGLSLVTFSRIFNQLTSFRKQAVLLDYACENGLKQGLLSIRSGFLDAESPRRITPEAFDGLLMDAANRGTAAAETWLGKLPQERQSGSLGDLEWELTSVLEPGSWKETGTAFSAEYVATLHADGGIRGFPPRQAAQAEARAEILAGRLPLALFPLLLDRDPAGTGIEDYLDKKGIEIAPGEEETGAPPAAAAAEGLLPSQASQLLCRALKIREFSPDDLAPAALRRALGLEISNEPVPEGVYLIEDDLGLGGVFVQGGLERMILAVSGGYQVISFSTGERQWMLTFNPEESKTRFITPEETRSYDRIPLGIIYVTGPIQSLGGGTLDESGKAVLVTDREIPCLRRGVRLTIISPEEITLSSHLIREGVTWDSGIPYATDAGNHMEIFAAAAGHDGTVGPGVIRIDESAPEDLKVTASLTAAGEGVIQDGEGRDLRLLGSLHTTDYSGGDNRMRLTIEKPVSDPLGIYVNSPATAAPLIHLHRFQITEWRENIL